MIFLTLGCQQPNVAKKKMHLNICSIYPLFINCPGYSVNVRRLVRWVHPTCSSAIRRHGFERFLIVQARCL